MRVSFFERRPKRRTSSPTQEPDCACRPPILETFRARARPRDAQFFAEATCERDNQVSAGAFHQEMVIMLSMDFRRLDYDALREAPLRPSNKRGMKTYARGPRGVNGPLRLNSRSRDEVGDDILSLWERPGPGAACHSIKSPAPKFPQHDRPPPPCYRDEPAIGLSFPSWSPAFLLLSRSPQRRARPGEPPPLRAFRWPG